MRNFLKRRQQDTFRDGQETKLSALLRAWLNWTGAGICRSRRTKNPKGDESADNQATESVKDVPHLESASIATKKPGNVDFHLLLKKRSGQSLSDKPTEEASGKAVQE